MLCKRNKKQKSLAEAEAWLAEASASYAAEDADSSTTIPADSAAPPVDRPTWPAALYEMGSEAFEAITGSQRGKKLLGSTVLAIRAVRLARSSACRELCSGNFLQRAEEAPNFPIRHRATS